MIPADRAMVFLLALLACLAVLVPLLFLACGTARAPPVRKRTSSTTTPARRIAIHRQLSSSNCSPSISQPQAAACTHGGDGGFR